MERKFKLKHNTVLSKAGDVFIEIDKLYNKDIFSNGKEYYTLQQILEHLDSFEEIKESKYTWEKCFSGKGYVIRIFSNIDYVKSLPNCDENKNVFLLDKQAKSALAMAQLSHIIAVANTNENGVVEEQNGYNGFTIEFDFESNMIIFFRSPYCKTYLWFRTEEIAREVYEENKELIHDYLMIEI
jgi:hypothetical protein